MASMTRGPETRLVYFTVFWLSGELVGANGLLPQTEGGGKVCCGGGASNPCPNELASRKKCGPGESHSNPRCDACRPVPECQRGEELHCSGTNDFSFFCKECPLGTYSDGKTGCCRAWTDCTSNGLQTVQQGNHTHNAQCGIVLSTVETDSLFTSILAIVTAAGIFLIILMMFFLLLCMWVQKREKLPDMEDTEAVDASNLLQAPQQPEDTFSCQYPEEEQGHKTAGEKDSMPFLAH
uniref:tumor necrosis factor receptor superfamily member 18 n=1 Tax=Euleptes europaea TaxID=460621 RepID=UPI0025423DAF|nr:tumor necrosis factor receptor superfamily member 18 [Euleptes europaea]